MRESVFSRDMCGIGTQVCSFSEYPAMQSGKTKSMRAGCIVSKKAVQDERGSA